MTRVYVGVPVLGWIRHELARSLIEISHDGRYELEIAFIRTHPGSASRHKIINNCLNTDAEYLLMLDSDATPYANPLDLVEYDLDVVAMACPIWNPTLRPPVTLNARPADGSLTVTLGSGLVEVLQASTSVVLVARRVLEHPEMKNPFAFQFDDDGLTTVDNDITFFWKAREAGFKVWVSLDHVCGHIKEVDVVDIANAVEKWRA